jgi:DNA replication protein DnaT
MSSRILTTSIAGIDAFMRDPRGVLTHAEGGTVAFLPTTRRRFTQSRRNVWHSFWRLKRNCHARRAISRWITSSLMSRLTPRDRSDGKICPVRGLAAGCRFSAAGRAVGHCANPAATAEELAAFTAWWQAEGKVFTHIQWQQKLARHLQITRASNNGQNAISTRFQNRINRSPTDSEVRNEERRRPDETSAKNDACQREARFHHG